MPIFGDLADNDFVNKLSDYYAQRIGAADFSDIRTEAKRDNPQASLIRLQYRYKVQQAF